MTGKRITIIVCFAVVATIVGVSQTLLYVQGSPVAFACWFPLGLLSKWVSGNDLVMVLMSLAQFPALAGVIILQTRRSSLGKGLLLGGIFYAALLLIALFMIRR